MMRYFLLLIFILFTSSIYSQSNNIYQKLVKAPDDPDQWDNWRQELIDARDRIRKDLNYSGHLYALPEFRWAAECYNIYFLMLFDREFYDPEKNVFRVEDFVADIEKKFGSIDGIVLWHAYPRIGFDSRNQFDYYREFPGGLDGLKKLVDRFHQLGIRVFIDYNPWDTGTRRENQSDIDALVEIIAVIGADGIFLDTLTKSEQNFRDKLDSVRDGVVLESELALPIDRVFDHHMSWAQWFEDSEVPGILWNKWFERRHMMHQIKRWNPDHSSELQMAWMNGSGILVWENVFGSFIPWSKRDQSYLKIMTPVLHRYSDLFKGEGWFPLYPVLLNNVYANLWQDEKSMLWTLVNRDSTWIEGTVFMIPVKPGDKIYDLIRGEEINREETGLTEIKIKLPPRGIGAIYLTRGPEEDISTFLSNQKRLFRSLSTSTDRNFPEEKREKPTRRYSLSSDIPDSQILINDISDTIIINYLQRECGFYQYPGYVMPPAKNHQVIDFQKPIDLKKFIIDKYPVSNRDFYVFIKSTGYKPSDPSNFLAHWQDSHPSEHQMDQPVVYINLDDAKAYASWKGGRLPLEEEWQVAMQEFTTSPDQEITTSPYGKVWEMTHSIYTDGRTEFMIVKGGSEFEAEGSDWYAQGGKQSAEMSAKYILFWPGLDRSENLSFRIVTDLKE